MDDGGAVFDLDPEHPVSRYQATSDIAQAGAGDFAPRAEIYPPGCDLQLPGVARARSSHSATGGTDHSFGGQQLRQGAGAGEPIFALTSRYTLQLSRTVPHDPLANFLFERKQGHCEYFASSMAVMLRTLGIPSRVVNGFRTGEFNDLTSQYVVRASNAHSWVEAYFPGYGWIAFDPTPGRGDAGAHRLGPGDVCTWTPWLRSGGSGSSTTMRATSRPWR